MKIKLHSSDSGRLYILEEEFKKTNKFKELLEKAKEVWKLIKSK
jgi:hypothetical protein